MTGIERLRELSGELHSALLSEIADQIEREHAQTVEDHKKQQGIIRDLQHERDEALRAAAASRKVASELRTLAGAWDEYGLGGPLMSLAERLEAHEAAVAHSTEVTSKTYTRDEIDERNASCDDHTSESDATFEGEKVTRDVSIAVPVLAVVEEMERHFLGVEGAGDSPVARWARELREAVAGKTEDEEDARAAKWVRENGGLGAVSAAFNRHLTAINRLYRMAFPEEGKNYEFPTVDDCFAELDRRLMPPGMEWPCYEDEEKVCIANKIASQEDGEALFVRAILVDNAGVDLISDECSEHFGFGERVKRPKPAPVGADGVPIINGESVYEIGGDGTRLTVVRTPESGEYQAIVVKFPDGNETTLDPPRLTHTKPEPPDSRQAVVNEIGDEMAARIDILISSGRWSDAD